MLPKQAGDIQNVSHLTPELIPPPHSNSFLIPRVFFKFSVSVIKNAINYNSNKLFKVNKPNFYLKFNYNYFPYTIITIKNQPHNIIMYSLKKN